MPGTPHIEAHHAVSGYGDPRILFGSELSGGLLGGCRLGRWGHLEVVQFLHEQGTQLTARTTDDIQPIHCTKDRIVKEHKVMLEKEKLPRKARAVATGVLPLESR